MTNYNLFVVHVINNNKEKKRMRNYYTLKPAVCPFVNRITNRVNLYNVPFTQRTPQRKNYDYLIINYLIHLTYVKVMDGKKRGIK